MTVFKCKMCGGDLQVDPGKTIGVCEYCGTQQTLPKLDDDRRAQMYNRANHFRRNSDYDKAAGIYEMILNEDNTDAEAYWSLVLCKYGVEYVEDPKTGKRIATCNRAQFISILADEDYKQALANADENQRAIYEEEARAIDKIQKGILEISSREEPFDVFICYKETDEQGRRTRDSVIAQELYHELTKEGFKVFFARITLENVLGTAYEPYIFAALNSAKVMVVLGTRKENFNAVWVKNEWSRYLGLIKSGAKKVLIPAYRGMDPYDLPDEFSHLQAQDMSKLGFMQDLVRGIKKVIGADNPKTAAKETIPTVSSAGVGGSVDTLMKRAFMFLEDGDFPQAKDYFNRVLDADPENSKAYIGLLCIDLNYKREEYLQNCTPEVADNQNFKKALRFASEDYKQTLMGYMKDMQLNLAKEKSKNILSFAEAAEILTRLDGYKNSDELLREMKDKIKDITQIALTSDDYQVKYDTIAQLHSIGSFGDAERFAGQLTGHVNTLVAQTIERANALYEINTLTAIEEAVKIITPFVQRSDTAAEFMKKLVNAQEALISARKKEEKRKARKRNLIIAAGFALVLFAGIWSSTHGFANIRYSSNRDMGNGLILVRKGGEYGIINRSGFVVVPCVYDGIGDFNDDGVAVVKKSGEYRDQYGLINKSGKELVPCVYDHISNFYDGLAVVEKDRRYGYINTSGKEVVPCVYQIASYFKDGLAVVGNDNKRGLIDTSGKELTPCVYENLWEFIDGLARVQKDHKYGFIDASGREVIPCVYEDAEDFIDGLAKVEKDLMCGFINTSGDVVVPLVYDFAEDFRDGFAVVRKNWRYGLVDTSGKEVAPCIYEVISGVFEDGLTYAKKDGRVIYLNKSGEEVKK